MSDQENQSPDTQKIQDSQDTKYQGSKYNSVIAWFVANPVAANLLMILVITLGVMHVGSIRKEAFPSMEPSSIAISVSYDSGSARQAEEGLAIKIEEQLQDVAGIKTITSNSTASGVSVTVEKEDDADLSTLLDDVTAKIDGISTFPSEARNPVIEKATREEHSLWIQLYGDTDRHTLQQLADRLKNDLLARSDISKVSISGRLDPMISVELDEGKLESLGIDLSTVEDAINEFSGSAASSVLRNDRLNLQIKAQEQAYQYQDFAAIPLITDADGNQLLLGEVATIRDTFSDDSSVLSRFNGHLSLGLQVVTTGQDDISDSVAAARKVVDQWRTDGKLVQGVELITWYDRSTSITQRLQLLVKNAITGIALVFGLLALFLNLTVAFWVAMGLPFIFFGTLYFMGPQYANLSLNEFTTFGFIMALGIVVDDAVVIGESVYATRMREGDSRTATIKGTMQVALPTLFGVLTTVAAFYALSQTSGGLGKLYAQFATVVAIALILSVIESKLILPAHLAHLNTTRERSRNPLMRLIQLLQLGTDCSLEWFSNRIYRPIILFSLNCRYAIVLLFGALFFGVIGMVLTGVVRMSFFPDIPGDTVRAELAMENDATYGQTHEALLRLEQAAYLADSSLRHQPTLPTQPTQPRQQGQQIQQGNPPQLPLPPRSQNVPESGLNARQPEQSTADTSPPELSDTCAIAHLQVISEADQSGRITVELNKNAPYDINRFTREWQRLAGTPPGTRTLMIQNAPRMVDALRIELRGDDDTILTAAGEELKEMLASTAGVSGLEDNLAPGQPQLQLRLNRLGSSLGLTTEMLAEQLRQGFNGRVVQRFQRNSDEIEVKVRYPAESHDTAQDVLNSRIRTGDGTILPLTDVAHIDYRYTRESITRIDRKRAVTISGDVDKDVISTTELVAKLEQTVVPKLTAKYPGIALHFGGEAEQQAKTQKSMTKMFVLALLLIYILLAVPLSSYIQPVLIMTAIPFGIVGAILGHWFCNLSLGILSLNGIIALSGVVVNDSLLLVSSSNELYREGGENTRGNLPGAIVEACRGRLRPVLLTSLTTYAGLIPLLQETSMQAQFLIPAAVSLAYGVMFATLITLILIPALLMIVDDVQRWLLRLKRVVLGRPAERDTLRAQQARQGLKR